MKNIEINILIKNLCGFYYCIAFAAGNQHPANRK
jgi:hypothetical protein